MTTTDTGTDRPAITFERIYLGVASFAWRAPADADGVYPFLRIGTDRRWSLYFRDSKFANDRTVDSVFGAAVADLDVEGALRWARTVIAARCPTPPAPAELTDEQQRDTFDAGFEAASYHDTRPGERVELATVDGLFIWAMANDGRVPLMNESTPGFWLFVREFEAGVEAYRGEDIEPATKSQRSCGGCGDAHCNHPYATAVQS